MIIVGVIIIILLLIILFEIGNITTNTRSLGVYLNDIKNKLDDIIDRIKNK